MDIIDGIYLKAGKKPLYTKITGEGKPAIIIETGLGSLSAEWTLIQAELSKTTCVLSYDRYGYGESVRSADPRTSGNVCSELNKMLINSGLEPPFIFVGNSSGGLYIQHFAKLYPDMVGAVLLMDSMTTRNGEFDRLDTPVYQKTISTQARMKNIENYLKLDEERFESFVRPFLQKLYPGYPEPIKNQLITYQSDLDLYRTIIDEFKGLKESYKKIKAAGDFPDVPLKVLCRDPEEMKKLAREIGVPDEESDMVEKLWLEQSKELMTLSDDSEFKLIKGANHQMHLTKPKAILDEILDMYQNFGNYFEIG